MLTQLKSILSGDSAVADRESVIKITASDFQGAMRQYLESEKGGTVCSQFFEEARTGMSDRQVVSQGELAVLVHDMIRDRTDFYQRAGVRM